MGFWRTEDPVINKLPDGTVEIVKGGMWPHQRKIWESDAYIKALVGGYGSGKSITAIKRGIALSLENAGIPGMIVSPNYDQARKTIVTDMKAMLDGRKIDYEYKVQAKEFLIYYKNLTGIIWIGSGDKPDSLKGPNLAWAIIDEPFIQSKDVFMQMMARVRHASAKHREILLTGTPEQLNWGYDIIAGDEAENYNVFLVQASTKDNKVNPDTYIKSLESGYDTKTKQAYMNGEFVDLSASRVYYAYERAKNVKDVEYDGQELQVGMDFNVDPMSAVIFYVDGSTVNVVEEVKISDANTDAMANRVREIIEHRNPSQVGSYIKVYPDPTGRGRKTSAAVGQTDHTILKDHKFTVLIPSGNINNRDAYNIVNKKLEDGELIIDTSCKQLQKDYARISYDKSKAKLEAEGLTHMSDAMKYAMYYLFPIKFKIERSRKWVNI